MSLNACDLTPQGIMRQQIKDLTRDKQRLTKELGEVSDSLLYAHMVYRKTYGDVCNHVLGSYAGARKFCLYCQREFVPHDNDGETI